MKKVLILSLLFIMGITKTTNDIAKTLYSVSIISGIKALMNFPIGSRLLVLTSKGLTSEGTPFTELFLRKILPNLSVVKGSGWASLGVLCYTMAKRTTD